MAKVLNLFRAPKRRLPMEELSEAQVIGNVGFEGCVHTRPNGKRAGAADDIETLRSMELAPGMVRENIRRGRVGSECAQSWAKAAGRRSGVCDEHDLRAMRALVKLRTGL